MSIKDFQNGIIVGLSAAGKTILDRGRACAVPDAKSKISITALRDKCKVWITSTAMTTPFKSKINIHTINNKVAAGLCPYYFSNVDSLAIEEKTVSMPTKLGDSIYAFIFYSMTSDSVDKGYSLDNDWNLLYTTSSRHISGTEYYVDVYKRNKQGLGSIENFKISNTTDRHLCCYFIDFWNYQGTLKPRKDLEKFGAGKIIQNKITQNPILWIIWDESSREQEVKIYPDTLNLFRIFRFDNKEDIICIDLEKPGEREFVSSSGSSEINISAVELI